MKTPSFILAASTLLVALLAWAGVFFFAQSIHSRQETTAKVIDDYTQAHTSSESINQMRALVLATESTRAQIHHVVNIDILSLVEMIETAGADAGVVVRVANATPDNTPVKNNSNQKGVSNIRFSIEGQGTFPKLYTALGLLENLSLPTQIEEVIFVRQGENVNMPWAMQVRMRVVTALPLNS